ncbi:hypothetical protein ACFC0D_03265 [Streptomyces sp. NPDC056222]|uniref:hypothetical protein n=1 Tax=Streptomyces sp. NPDC056222 TaxID=3345749 RepID=UPI0035DB340C
MDDERILAEMESGLSRDAPVLVARTETLNEQFPQPDRPENARHSRPDPRLVTAIALAMVAARALIIAAALNSPPAPLDGEGAKPAALSAVFATDP